MTKEEKGRVRAGETADEIWPDAPARAAQKDTDARRTVRYSRARKTKDGGKDAGLVDLAIPHFGYKTHISIDRKWRFIRAARPQRMPPAMTGMSWPRCLDPANRSGKVWADTGYRSARNEAWLKANGFISHIHRKKPRGKPMPKHIGAAMPPAQRSGRASSMCSGIRRGRWSFPSAVSAGAAPQGGSPWRTSPTISAA